MTLDSGNIKFMRILRC